MKHRVWISMAAVVLLAAGCLVSAQHTETIDFVDVDTAFTNGLVKESVNLADYTSDYDKIERIDKVKFDAIVRNDLTAKDTIDVYVSENQSHTTRTAVKNAKDVLPVLLGYVTPVGPGAVDTLSIKQADALLQLTGDNWTRVRTLLATGKFTVYVTSTGATAQGEVVKANVYLTFTLNE